MFQHLFWEPLRAYWARKRLERLECETAARMLQGPACESQRIEEDPDRRDWRLIGPPKGADEEDQERLRDRARYLADHNPYARNILILYRNYTVGAGMRHEVAWRRHAQGAGRLAERQQPAALERLGRLWAEFLAVNEWDTGNRRDWEFCLRTWRDGECFLRLFRQPDWPPRVHFVDPEQIAPDPRTGQPAGGIETAPDNVEMPLAYQVTANDRSERVEADRILHTKIGVDANVLRGQSLFLPILEPLQRFQGWLEVELIHRKMASSIVLVRKHQQNYPDGVAAFADAARTGTTRLEGEALRRLRLQPGSIIDAQGFDLEYLAPDTHFDDAALLGRMILLSIAAGTGLPEYMLTADASNANYSSTLVAESPAIKHFTAWQAFFIGQWQKLFGMVMSEAVRLGLAAAEEASQAALEITPPPLPVRNRLEEARADALYFDRGALSARELARRDRADPERMRHERAEETAYRGESP